VILARALEEDKNETFNCTVKAMLAFAAEQVAEQRKRDAEICRALTIRCSLCGAHDEHDTCETAGPEDYAQAIEKQP